MIISEYTESYIFKNTLHFHHTYSPYMHCLCITWSVNFSFELHHSWKPRVVHCFISLKQQLLHCFNQPPSPLISILSTLAILILFSPHEYLPMLSTCQNCVKFFCIACERNIVQKLNTKLLTYISTNTGIKHITVYNLHLHFHIFERITLYSDLLVGQCKEFLQSCFYWLTFCNCLYII